MGSLMDSFLEGMAEGAGMTEDEKKEMMEPVKGFKCEVTEEDGHKIEKMTFRGNKGAFFAFKDYITDVTITDDSNFCISTKKIKKNFTKSEVVKAEYKFIPLVTPLDIIRFAVSAVFLFILPYAAVALAIVSFIAMLIKTVKITLNDNTTVKIYCKRKEAADILLSKLQ